jgi:MFS family permease
MGLWLAAAGAFVVSLDAMMNIAFPAIAAGFAVPPETIRWVIICYTGVYAVTALAGGAAADLVGHMRVFRLGVGGLALSLLAGGLAQSFGWLLWARVAQGLSSGLIYGTAPGLVTLAVVAGRRGRALGALNGAIALGFAFGSLPAGVLVDVFGWRSVLLVRVPLACAVFAGTMILRVGGQAPSGRRLVRLSDMRRTPVPVACVLAFLSYAAIFSIWLLAPFYLVERRGFGAGWGGLLFSLTPLGTTIAAPLAGRLADRAGAAALMVGGLALETAGLGALAFADGSTSIAYLAAALLAAGLGVGVFQVPMMTLVMGAFPMELQGAAGGLTFFSRTLGLVAGVFVLAELFAARRTVAGFDGAFGDAFVVAAGMVALGVVLALVRVRSLRPRA